MDKRGSIWKAVLEAASLGLVNYSPAVVLPRQRMRRTFRHRGRIAGAIHRYRRAMKTRKRRRHGHRTGGRCK